MNGLLLLLVIWFVVKKIKEYTACQYETLPPTPEAVAVDSRSYERLLRQQEQERKREERENKQKAERAKKALETVKRQQTNRQQIEHLEFLQFDLLEYMQALNREEKAIVEAEKTITAEKAGLLDKLAAVDNDPLAIARTEKQRAIAAAEKAELQKQIARLDRQSAVNAGKRTTIASKRASLSSRIANNENRIARLQADA